MRLTYSLTEAFDRKRGDSLPVPREPLELEFGPDYSLATVLDEVREFALRGSSAQDVLLLPYVVSSERGSETGYMVAFTYQPGIDSSGGLILAESPEDITWSQFLSAVSAGYYGDDAEEICFAPAPAFGGLGDLPVDDLVTWLRSNSPEIVFAYVASKASDWTLAKLTHRQERRLQALANDWAARHIDSPSKLRKWLESRTEWQSEEVAKRLRLNLEATTELLESLGFVDAGRGVYRLVAPVETLHRRDAWIRGEHDEMYRNIAETGRNETRRNFTPRLRKLFRRR